MPVVVVDTNVSLPATLTSTGLTRKFWILLAFGAATYRAEHLQLELDGLEREAADLGGEPGAQETLQRLTTQAERARAAMEKLLPVGTVPALTTDPDDDLIVWTSLSASVELLISDDKHIVPPDADGTRFYKHGDTSVLGARFRYLVENRLDGVDWAQIDGAMLPQLYRAGARDES